MRYFIIFYNWTYKDQEATGSLHGGYSSYPSMSKATQDIADMSKEKFNLDYDIPPHCVIITNILELSKSDYESWIK